MKLKEYPKAFFFASKLNRLNLEKLHNTTANDLPIVVTMTSYGPRLKHVHQTIRSILGQTFPPKKIVLWLSQQYQYQLPTSLKNTLGPKFEIRYSLLDCPHLKLVESIKYFPSDLLVTCDDDLLYHDGFLKTLFDDHQLHPKDIMAHECRMITRGPDSNQLQPYTDWKYSKDPGASAINYLALGYAGVLYPPNSLDQRVVDHELFLKLSPHADDLWLKAMSLLKNTATRKTSMPNRPHPMITSQQFSLKKQNVREDKNRLQWKQLCDYFSLTV